MPGPASELTLAFSRIARVDLASVVSYRLNQLAGPGFVSGLGPSRPEPAGELFRVSGPSRPTTVSPCLLTKVGQGRTGSAGGPSLNGLCLGSPQSARRREFQVTCPLSFHWQVKCSSQPRPCLGSLESGRTLPSLSRMQDCNVDSLNGGLRCQYNESRSFER